MSKLTYENIEETKLILYKYIRGSHLYGLNTETSDIDTGSIYCAPIEHLIGTRIDYQDLVADTKQDNVYYELEKYIQLLSNSNPNILESLFVPDKFIIYKHPAMDVILKNANKFLTKKCFKSFYGYAKSQIGKAKSLHKMINMDKPEHKIILDFCYIPYKQGSTKIINWLSYRNLDQKFVGCVNVPNMVCAVNLFYDWGAHIEANKYAFDIDQLKNDYNRLEEDMANMDQPYLMSRIKNLEKDPTEQDGTLVRMLKNQYMFNKQLICLDFIIKTYNIQSFDELLKWVETQKATVRKYKGMVSVNAEGKISDELRLSSVLEGELPIGTITCNINGYSEHCKRYKEYCEWETMRNPVRYESNLHKSYDAKNMMHCFRLIKMCIEIAKGEGCILNRSNIDREFLLDIKNHKYEYDELIEKLDTLCKEMDEAIESSTIPDEIDESELDRICIEIRQAFWESKNV